MSVSVKSHFKSCLLLGSVLLLPLQSGCTAGGESTPPSPAAPAASLEKRPVLSLEKRTELPGFKGDYDRVGADEHLNTLYIAGEDSSKIEVVDLRSNAHRQSLDLETPHYIATVPGRNEIVVTHTGGDGRSVIISSETNKVVASIKHRPGANSMAYDTPRNRVYVVAGGKNMGEKDTSLIEIDPINRKQVRELKLAVEKVQALAVEERGSRLFTNVTTLKQVAVIDKNSHTVKEMWPITAPGDNGLLALDEKRGHLFVGMRRPDGLLVLDTKTGATIAKLNMPGSCDNLIFDEQNDRLYALGGEGRIAVYQRNAGGQYAELPSIQSEPGGKTGLLVPSAGKLFVAISPGESGRPGAVLTFKVND